MNTSSTATADSFDAATQGSGAHRRHGCCGGTSKRKWSAVELAVMIGGFVIFWPVGLVALAIKLVKGEMWPGASESTSPWTAYKSWREKNGSQPFAAPFGAHSSPWSSGTATGNAAFDTYKKEQLARLEAERRKLEDEQKAFAEYLVKLRQAKDQDEFDRFMAERNVQPSQP